MIDVPTGKSRILRDLVGESHGSVWGVVIALEYICWWSAQGISCLYEARRTPIYDNFHGNIDYQVGDSIGRLLFEGVIKIKVILSLIRAFPLCRPALKSHSRVEDDHYDHGKDKIQDERT